MSKDASITSQEQGALVRYRAITFLTELLEEGLPLAEALRQAAARPWPSDHGRCYSARTLEDWWYAYQKGGFAALTREARQDVGQLHALSTEQQQWLVTERELHPDIPVKVAYEHWKEQEQGRDLPSLSTVYRFLRKVGLLEPEHTDVDGNGPSKAFEAPFPNDLWMADFSPGPKLITPDGASLSTHLSVIIDDHSRLLPYAAYYRQENTESFHHTLKEAVLRRGVPLKLYTDNGAAFISTHTHIVCANLGIRLLHHKPYRAWSKGKVERVIHTIQLGFETTLSLPEEQVYSLEALNAKLSQWIQSRYHTRSHSSTGMSPEVRFRQGAEHLRGLEMDSATLNKLFRTRIQRTVRKNGTIRLHNRLYEVNLSLRGRRIELHYDPFDANSIPDVYHQGHYVGHAQPANLHLNSQLPDGQNYER